MNSFFDWLKDSGTQAILVLLGTIAACMAACAAIYYGRKSLTRADLKEVEGNTAHLEEVRSGISAMTSRLMKQEEAEQLKTRASRVPITATANQAGNGPYQLGLQVGQQPEGTSVSLTDVELYNERDNFFGSFPCTSTGNPGGFRIDIPMHKMALWFRSGTPDQAFNRMRLKLKVKMSISGVAASRDMAVLVISPSNGMEGYLVEGSV